MTVTSPNPNAPRRPSRLSEPPLELRQSAREVTDGMPEMDLDAQSSSTILRAQEHAVTFDDADDSLISPSRKDGGSSRSDSMDAGHAGDGEDSWTEQLKRSLSSLKPESPTPTVVKSRMDGHGKAANSEPGSTGQSHRSPEWRPTLGGASNLRFDSTDATAVGSASTTPVNKIVSPRRHDSEHTLPWASSHPGSAHQQLFNRVPSLSSSSSYRASISGPSASATRLTPLGSKERLKRDERGLIKRRDGSVLVRGFILKTDHYPTGRAMDLDFHLDGAPNWRGPKEDGLNVYGSAQPTVAGLRGILSVLGCRPPTAVNGKEDHRLNDHQKSTMNGEAEEPIVKCVWFCTREEPIVYISGRPFVLRDSSAPKTTLSLSDRAENLEQMESRLKDDILKEARRYGGLILTHDEIENGDLMPTWTSVDEHSVKTVKEVYDSFRAQGWAVEYHRTPISSDRPIEDNYLDAYVSVLRHVDPLSTCLVFNDGMGAVRATYGMAAALLVRRKQYLLRDLDEPFQNATGSGVNTPAHGANFLKQAAKTQAENKALLHLTSALHKVLQDPLKATTFLASNSTLLDSLRNAHMGNYQVILSLLSSIEQGRETKALVDAVIDSCDAVVNLREMIVELRMRYSVSTADEKTRLAVLDRALRALEIYFFLIAFARYVEEEQAGSTGKRFSDWLLARPEIWNQIQVMRRRGGGRLFIFSPVNDLSPLTRAVAPTTGVTSNAAVEVVGADDHVVGDEFSQYVISQRSGIMLRSGTLLKSDRWGAAVGFRRVRESPIFALGQPSRDDVLQVVLQTREQLPELRKVLWLNLREEPVVMVCGDPYCLRKENMSLRNLKDYSGVSGSRLEVLEDRLVSDVKAELRTFDGKVLLHTETSEGRVAPIWEDVRPDEVESLRQLFDRARSASKEIALDYRRLPLTAQSVLDFQDIQDLLLLCVRHDLQTTAIVVNDQLGRGRSSLASVYILLIVRWIRQAQDVAARTPRTPRLLPGTPKSSWQIINSCLRCIRRNGLEVKRTVDEAIDTCGEAFNCRTAIEGAFRAAEDAEDANAKRSILKDGKTHLSRYLQLIQFQAYLEDLPTNTNELPSFSAWCAKQPVFKTFEAEIRHGDVDILTPLTGTIIKSDLFLNLQKMSLPERVDGVANYRKESLLMQGRSSKSIYGTGMPTAEGLRRALKKMNAGPRKIKWTSLREEPVLYIAGVPHVLRIADKPITNIETTGVDANLVEAMEESFKRDVLEEIRSDGRILLHDEIETKPGHYEIVPVWETVGPEDIKTPRDLYRQVEDEGYEIDYRRIAVTDEQAPLPEALTAIIERVKGGLEDERVDYVFNCQMGRGRTTTGMIATTIIASIAQAENIQKLTESDRPDDNEEDTSEKVAYLRGDYKIILQLTSVLSHGKEAKIIADKAIDAMAGVQNLRSAVYDFKVKMDAAPAGSATRRDILRVGMNYAYRYAMLVVLTAYLLECREHRDQNGSIVDPPFSIWLKEKREIRNILSRQTLD